MRRRRVPRLPTRCVRVALDTYATSVQSSRREGARSGQFAIVAAVVLLLVLVPSALAFYDYVSERHRPGRRRRPFGSWRAVAAAGIIGSAIVAGALWLPRSSGAGNTYPPTNPFHVFSESADAATGDVAASLEHHDGDPSGFHVLGKGLGRFDSRLVAFPSNGGICYSLTPQDRSNAGGGYCFVPGNRAASGSVAGLHFSALAFWSDIPEGNGGVQVFGVAYDDVSRSTCWCQANGDLLSLPTMDSSWTFRQRRATT